jgi:hypothetical protein
MRTYSNSIVIQFDNSGTGNAGSGKPVTVFEAGTTTKALLFDNGLNALNNPVQADDSGNYTFTVNDGTYDIYIDYGLPTQTAILNEQIANTVDNPPLSPGDLVVAFDTLEEAVNETNPLKMFIGAALNLREPVVGSGLGSMWDVVDSSTVQVNGRDVLLIDGIPSLAMVKRKTWNSSSNGIKVTRANNKKHYGWGSTAILPDGRWMQIFRASSTHATENGAQVLVHFSNDEGSTWYGEYEVYSQPTSDARPDALWVMANGRIGFMLNRATSPALSPHYSPLFMYTDNNGATWNSVVVTMPSPYTFQAAGGMTEFPTSQGGDDTNGFITFGFASAGQLDALTTVDNGASWSIVDDINGVGAFADSLSETCYARIGDSDRWLIYSRAKKDGDWTDQSVVFATTNLLDWGTPILSGVLNKGTPPAMAYNSRKGTIDLYVVARGGKDLYDYDNALLVASEDAEVLWAASGAYTGYPARVAELPNWFTGYLKPFRSGSAYYFTMMFGENPTSSNGSTSAVAVLSDVPTNSKDAATISKITNNYIECSNIKVIAESNVTTEAAITLNNNAENISARYGGYEDRHTTPAIEYLSYFSDDYRQDVQGDFTIDTGGELWLSPQNIILGATNNTEGMSAAVHLGVASSSSPSLISHAVGTSNARTHITFTNPNGIIGSIVGSGSATAYNTSSDPRLKTEFTDLSYDEARSVINNLYDCTGKFQFKGDLDVDVVGFNAHKVIDIQGLGSEIGTEGNGSRDKAIGEVVGLNELGEELKVSPASVDQSKAVPYLLLAVKTLMDKDAEKDALIAELTGRIETLEGN